jgi:hypothetical protein
MAIRMRPSIVVMTAGLALSGCIDVECPAEFARPISRERFCGHTGDVAAPVTYRPYVNPSAPGGGPAVTTTNRMVAPPPPPMVQAAPPPPVTVQPMAPPSGGAPTQIR